MRKDFGAQPFLYPQLVMVIASYGEDGTPDAMNAAWGGVAGGDKVFLCLSANHKTVENILNRKAFTVSVADEAHLVEADYVGLVSGNEVPDKLERSGLHVTHSEFVDAPVIDELPLVLECRLVSYDPETHFLLGQIVNAGADEAILDEVGMIDPAKLRPITFDPANRAYWGLGQKVDNAFADGRRLQGPQTENSASV